MPVFRVEAKKLGTLDIEADGFKIAGDFVVFYETYQDGRNGADIALIPLQHLRGIVKLSALRTTEQPSKKDKDKKDKEKGAKKGERLQEG